MVFSLRILGLRALLIGAVALGGCGQKGPLFLPAPLRVAPPALLPPPTLTDLGDDAFPITAPDLPASAAR